MTEQSSEKTKVDTRVARLRYAGGEAFVAETQSGHALVTSFAHEPRSAASPMELLLVALGGMHRCRRRFDPGKEKAAGHRV